MGYLKALGVFRLVADPDEKQGDRDARLSWVGGRARLHSKFDRRGLADFFLNHYRPTPILAPWNGGSGFYGGGAEPLDAIAEADNPRLERYRQAIECVRRFVPSGKPKDEGKDALLMRCRAELADDVVPWLDVCYVLGEAADRPGELKPTFFPLLGTGGNDGRLDFTNNFMQRVADVVPLAGTEPSAASAAWLADALFADAMVGLKDVAVGQFNPGGIGGPNGTQGRFEAGSRVNPWDFVLMIEGAVLFAGSVARRLGANGTGRAVFPFAVESVAVGYGSATASEETTDGSRAELWLPLWDAPATLPEVGRLFAEGRAQVNRRQARNAVEFALAVNLLGVSRGVTAFARYGFLKRNGLAFLAAPLGRVPVTPRPAARLLDDPPLTAWLDGWRRACREKDKTPARYQAALRGVDRAVFAFANRSETGEAADRRALLAVLAAVGRAERTLAGGLRFAQEKYLRPLAGLSPQWLDQLAGVESAEFRLAAALAGIGREGDVGPLREHLEEVEAKAFVAWNPGSTSAVWSRRPAAANLAAVFRRRQMEAFRTGVAGVPLGSPRPARPARLGDVLAFLRGGPGFDDELLADLLWGLVAVEWSEVPKQEPPPADPDDLELPVEFGLARLLVNPLSLTADRGRWRLADAVTEHAAKPDPAVFDAIAAGRPDAVEVAARRLYAGGLTPTGLRCRQIDRRELKVVSPHLRPGRSDRLLAAMLFPLSAADLTTIADAVLSPPETPE
jgi:CRISPR-associated protein Csx17